MKKKNVKGCIFYAIQPNKEYKNDPHIVHYSKHKIKKRTITTQSIQVNKMFGDMWGKMLGDVLDET